MAVSLVPVGPGVPSSLAAILKSHETAIRSLQQPGSPQPAYAVTKAKLPPAATFPSCIALVSDLDVLATSNGTAWIRSDTGAPI